MSIFYQNSTVSIREHHNQYWYQQESALSSRWRPKLVTVNCSGEQQHLNCARARAQSVDNNPLLTATDLKISVGFTLNVIVEIVKSQSRNLWQRIRITSENFSKKISRGWKSIAFPRQGSRQKWDKNVKKPGVKIMKYSCIFPGGDSAFERGGGARRKFWIKRRPIWAWPNLFLTPKSDHFKLWLHESSK